MEVQQQSTEGPTGPLGMRIELCYWLCGGNDVSDECMVVVLALTTLLESDILIFI
jgi:hypothetical protein